MKTRALYKTRVKGAKTALPKKIIKDYRLSDGDTIDWVIEKGRVVVAFPGHGAKLSELVGKIDMGKTSHEMIDEIVTD